MALTGDEAGKGPVDPPSDDNHWEDVGEGTLEHFHGHTGVTHGIKGIAGRPLLTFEVARVSVIKEVLPHEKGLGTGEGVWKTDGMEDS